MGIDEPEIARTMATSVKQRIACGERAEQKLAYRLRLWASLEHLQRAGGDASAVGTVWPLAG
jgi:hypothetical protein